MKPLPMALLIIAIFTAVVVMDNYPKSSSPNTEITKKQDSQKVQVSAINVQHQPDYQRD